MSISCLIIGYVVVGINVPLSTTLMRGVERDKLSKVSSLFSILSQGIVPLAHVLAGAVLQGLGSTAMLFMCAAGFLVTTIFLLINKRTKEIGTADRSEVKKEVLHRTSFFVFIESY